MCGEDGAQREVYKLKEEPEKRGGIGKRKEKEEDEETERNKGEESKKEKRKKRTKKRRETREKKVRGESCTIH